MILSMTGFGDAAAEHNSAHYSVEIRSLNNRYFKAVIKLPDNLSGLEPELESLLRAELGRGSITYVLKMRVDTAEAAYHINLRALEAYLNQLKAFRNNGTEIELGALLQLPGVLSEPRDESDEIEKHGAIVRDLTRQAIAKLIEMRKAEGRALFEDLMRHIWVID